MFHIRKVRYVILNNKYSSFNYENSLNNIISENKSTNTERLNRLEYNLKCVGDDLNKYDNFTEKLTKELEVVKNIEKKLKEECDTLQKPFKCLQTAIVSFEERILAKEKTSYNGTLVWKIANVRNKIEDAKADRQPSIDSQPFYTSQYGYKLCSRIYLNGDGIGRNTHISLSIVLMRGDYDAILIWPFSHKVTFTLFDQLTNDQFKENIKDEFKPDSNSKSFRKPTADMNIASGIPKFCSLAKFNSTDHEYVKDDTIFIKVDCRDFIDA